MKAAKATMLLLAVLVAAADATSPPDAVDHQPAAGGIAGTVRGQAAAGWTAKAKSGSGCRDGGDDGQKDKYFPAGLTQCVTICGTQTTTCLLDCYKPVGGNPVVLPLICLAKCTNNAMVCASGCSNDFV